MSEPTKGPWTVTENSWDMTSVYSPIGAVIAQCPIDHRVTEKTQDVYEREMIANARLIAEAGTVYDETGLTPRQMQEQIKELRGALATALAAMVGYLPLSDKTIEIARCALANTERKTA